MKKILLTIVGVGLLFGACSKDYLDVSSTRYISKSDIDKISENSPHLKDASLYGIYAYNMTPYSGGTSGHDDFGQKGYDIYTDMLSGDFNLNSRIYGWYSRVANLTDIDNFASNTNYKPWRFYYFMIRASNEIIVDLVGQDNNGIPKERKDKLVLAEAKALRAYMYYNLVNMYTLGYEANEKVLPIYTVAGYNNTPAKKTKEVYDLMINDLKSSLSLYESAEGTNIGDRITVNYNVAKGILAYVYASKGTTDALTEAAKLTNDIINSGRYSLATKEILLKGFNKEADNPNWMWSGKITTQTDLNLISWWGQVDVFTYSYAAVGDSKGMAKELYESINANDIRKKQFSNKPIVDVNGDKKDFGENAYLPIGKFYSAKGKVLEGQRIIESDYVYMRVEEMYLLNAEVNARLGNDGSAQISLTELMKIRLDDTSYIQSLSGANLLKEILYQTRVELWGEGKTYAAIKRNKGTFTYGSNHLFYKNQTFEYDNKRLTFKVPQSEIMNNPVYNN
ncbi:RagB/SusD family nutrient uptake outer membrane protein [Myroides odoratimimus]|uniref:RagB/SusD family nutrient uptake outer membrane protein n=1 Tax=Myroides odoratimimus TaxID=76832 RepID=UPI0025750CFE|nr:RagB/SusD family nutrient uptake outer membrane protein [Myroides odoratimimus]MDM1327977.1 RagB/SusD family nutrient uptake outer membrane protein [Myroides odoratimimus]